MAKNDARFPTVGASHHLAPGDSPDLPDLVPSGASSGARLKRATTVPFETPPRVRQRRRAVRVILSIAFWLLLLGGGTSLILAATGPNKTAEPSASDPDARAEAYLTAVDEFRSAWSPQAIARLGTTSIGITLETKYDEFSQTPRAYEALAEQCSALDTTRAHFDELQAVPPPIVPPSTQRSGNAELAARVDEAAASIAPLAAAANELLTEGMTRLDTLSALCDSLSRIEPIVDDRSSAMASDVTPLMVQPGASEQVATTSGTVEFACTGDVACQPLSSPARERYAAAISVVNTRFDKAAASFHSEHCPLPELAGYCSLASELYTARAKADTESEARFAKETPLNSSVPLPEYTAWLEKSDAELATKEAALDTWMATYLGDAPAAPDDDGFVTAVSGAAEVAESRFVQLRDAASAASAESAAG